MREASTDEAAHRDVEVTGAEKGSLRSKGGTYMDRGGGSRGPGPVPPSEAPTINSSSACSSATRSVPCLPYAYLISSCLQRPRRR